MAASATRGIDVAAAGGLPEPVEDLPFVQVRRLLFQYGDSISAKRRNDRTVELVTRWKTTAETLPRIRESILSTLEPIEGKGDTVTLRIFDRPRFNMIRETITANEKELAVIGAAIRELNSFAASDYLSELYDARSNLSGVEKQVRVTMSGEAQTAIARGQRRGLSAEQSLDTDEHYLARKKATDAQVMTAKKALAAVNEKASRIEAILDRVGC